MNANSRRGLGISFLLLLSLLLVGRDGSCTDPVEPWESWQHWEFELERLGHPVDTDSLRKILLESDDFLVRSLAARVLGARGESSAIPTLEKVARSDSNASVRQAAAWALATLGVPEGLELLKQRLLEEKELGRKLSAAFALADFGNYEGYEVVLTAAESERYWNRMAVAAGVHRFLKDDEAFPAKQRPSRLLLRLAEDSDARVRKQALVQFGRAAAITGLSDEFKDVAARLAAEDPSPEVKEGARRALWALENPIEKTENQSGEGHSPL